MLKDNFTIRETKRVMKDRNPIITVLLLFFAMQLPLIILGLLTGIILTATNPEIASNPAAAAQYMESLDPDLVMMVNLYLTLLVTIAVYIFAKYFLKKNKASLGLTSPNKGKNYLIGAGLGIIMIVVVVLVLRLIGLVEITSNLINVSPLMFILLIIGWMLQGFEEEFIMRSVLMNYFGAKYSVMVGIIVNSILFSLMHIINNAFSILPAINIFLVGALFSLLFYISDDIFLPAAVHSFWNFAQGNLFGIRVSGNIISENTLFKTDLLGSTLLTGGAFGIEGGLICTLVLAIVTAYLVKKAKEKSLNMPVEAVEVVEVEVKKEAN